MTEVYDKDVMGSSQIRKTGGETIGKDRKQPASMTRKKKAVGGGKMEPEKSRARRKDAGQQKPTSQIQQQPTQARGSAADAQKAAAKAERRAAAQARAKAKKSGQTSTTSSSMSSKDADKKATELLSKKSTTVKKEPSRTNRKWEHESGGGMTRQERDSARNKERSAKLKTKKSELINGFTETHGRPPKGAERTRLLGLAHKAVKAGA